ncbi:MAG: replicative DNA helicase [Selenomonadales bacterium]|nr:replicative DNA helicase [Selenomonadales bacterium]MDD6219201.1 replicative DNA helicase [Selenomonadaceae bacterium]
MPAENESIGRMPPHSIDAEQAVLGAIIINSRAINDVSSILLPGDFYREAHRIVFEAMLEMSYKGSPIDMLSLSEFLRDKNLFEKVGGVAFITHLSNISPSAANATYYAKIVKDKALLRNLINAASDIADSAFAGSDDIVNLLDNAERKVLAISASHDTGSAVPVKSLLKEAIGRIEMAYEAKGGLTGLPSGFDDLDRLTSGLQPSDLILLAARPSMGKTALTLNLAANVALRKKKSVAFFSLEMSSIQLLMRLISSESGVDSKQIQRGDVSPDEWAAIMGACDNLYNAPLYIDDNSNINVAELRSRARRIQSEHGLDLIIIDYLQLMQGRHTGSNDNRQQEVADISRSLKSLARELKVPVIALSQLSRSVENRQIKRPMLSDLRESGSLEQDADIVMFLYREDYYVKDTENQNITELIVAKHRNGPVDTVRLFFDKEITRFRNLAPKELEALEAISSAN